MSFILQNGEGEFWTGFSWGLEFPDAVRYSHKPKDCPKGAVWVVENYGEITEKRFRRCACCGRTFSRAGLDRLPRKADWPSEDDTGRYLLEQRDCPCGNTLALEHKLEG